MEAELVKNRDFEVTDFEVTKQRKVNEEENELINNPWLEFEASSNMIHPIDVGAVNHHNSRVESKYKLLSHLAPEPWIGNPEAEVLVLLANPGATLEDMVGMKQRKAELINDLSMRNLRHDIHDYPHFFFNPLLEGTDGHEWYRKRFGHLIKATSAENISKRILSCELIPYHSVSWKRPKLGIETQNYTNELVRRAIKRGAVILIGRGKRDWFSAVPGLEDYENYLRPNSSQCAYVSPNNYGNSFQMILDKVL